MRAQLYVAYDIGYLGVEMFKHLNGLALDCSRLLSSFIRSIKTSNVQGLQYKKEKSKAAREREEFDAYVRQQLRAGDPDLARRLGL